MPYCPECGKEIKRGIKFCPKCGAQIIPRGKSKEPIEKASSATDVSSIYRAFGILSIVFGIVGFLIAGIIFGSLALAFGAVAVAKKEYLGVGGIVLGLIDVIAVLIIIYSRL